MRAEDGRGDIVEPLIRGRDGHATPIFKVAYLVSCQCRGGSSRRHSGPYSPATCQHSSLMTGPRPICALWVTHHGTARCVIVSSSSCRRS